MTERELQLRLFAGTRLIGFLEPVDLDFPTVFAVFEAVDGFEEVRPLFVRQNSPDGFEDMREAMDALDLRIVHPNGREERLFTIVIDGQRAVWRGGFLRSTETESHDKFWRALGDEMGPEVCREPGCARLRIKHSVYCRRHHFRGIMNEDYRGTLSEA